MQCIAAGWGAQPKSASQLLIVREQRFDVAVAHLEVDAQRVCKEHGGRMVGLRPGRWIALRANGHGRPHELQDAFRFPDETAQLLLPVRVVGRPVPFCPQHPDPSRPCMGGTWLECIDFRTIPAIVSGCPAGRADEAGQVTQSQGEVMVCGHASRHHETSSCKADAIVAEGLFDDAVLARAARLGRARVPREETA